MSLKDNFRNKLRNWLFKDEIQQMKSAYNDYLVAKAMLEKATKQSNSAKELSKECLKAMNEVIDVGVNVEFDSDDHSWAVICIQGKPEYVKFMPLLEKDARELCTYLKQFEYSNKVVDSPLAFKDILTHYLKRCNYAD